MTLRSLPIRTTCSSTTDLSLWVALTWQELHDSFAEKKHPSTAEETKKALYYRLRDSLPDNSPPQRLLFESYFRRFTDAIPMLPALLPEVWLYWDPKAVLERGKDALLRFRMDFLMLLPNGVRIVIEVDGKQHFSDTSGLPSPQKYAEMVAADRDLRLAGYDVYRFGPSNSAGNRDFVRRATFSSVSLSSTNCRSTETSDLEG